MLLIKRQWVQSEIIKGQDRQFCDIQTEKKGNYGYLSTIFQVIGEAVSKNS